VVDAVDIVDGKTTCRPLSRSICLVLGHCVAHCSLALPRWYRPAMHARTLSRLTRFAPYPLNAKISFDRARERPLQQS
jgi:hypothetical protein